MPVQTSVITGTVAHKHSATGGSSDGGKLAVGGLGGDTSFDLTANSMLYSNGTSLEELTIGNASDVLTVSGGSPSWQAASTPTTAWEVLADVTITGAAGALNTGTFSAPDKFLRLLGYVGLDSSNTGGITCNNSAGTQDYAYRMTHNTTQSTNTNERSMNYLQGVATAEFCFFTMDIANMYETDDKLAHVTTFINSSTGAANAPELNDNYNKYCGGSYITRLDVTDANAGTAINCKVGSRLLLLASV